MGRIIPYILENKKRVWNHQPVYIYIIYIKLYIIEFPHKNLHGSCRDFPATFDRQNQWEFQDPKMEVR